MSKKRLEKLTERDGNRRAAKLGLLSRKMNGMGFNAWPDRLYIGRRKKLIWVEYKKIDEEPTPLQHEMHKQLRAAGQAVLVITDHNLEELYAALEKIAR